MNPTRPSGRSPRRRAAIALGASLVAVIASVVLSGFHTQLHDIDPVGPNDVSELTTSAVVGIRTFTPQGGIRIEPDVSYGTTDDGTRLDLDVCSPSSDPVDGQKRTAIVSIHGGSWARGDKANTDWRNVCEWFASEGFVAFSLDYRLVPAATFPAAIDDVSTAVEWVRAHADDYGIDPDRIGAFGGSAGGNLAALLGTQGEGPLDEGSRVAAVAELSGPVDLTDAAMHATGASDFVQRISRDYLGCASLAHCDQATEASATMFVDPTDPPFFIAHSEAEFIPLAQSQALANDLKSAGVSVDLQVVPGTNHSIGILDEAMRARVAAFFRATLGVPPVDPAGATDATEVSAAG